MDDDITCVAAAPGFDVLTYRGDCNFDARPVVAWAISLSGSGMRAFPITPEGGQIDLDPVVRLPDGTIICGDQEWPSTGEWVNACSAGTFPDPSPPYTKASVLALDAFRGKFAP